MHPQLAQDRKLAQVSREARYTFVLTWTISDDEGFFRAEPRQLLGQLYPFDVELEGRQLEAWLCELAAIGVLRWRQTKDGARVGEVVNWRRHQKIDRPSKSFLATQLEPLDTEARDSVEGPARPSMLESRVLSPESRVLSPESGGAAPQRSEAFLQLERQLPSHAIPALEGYHRAARHPGALALAILAETPDGIHAKAGVTWAVVGDALADMFAAGKEFAPVILRAFVRKLLEQPPAPKGNGVPTPSERAYARAAELERKAAS